MHKSCLLRWVERAVQVQLINDGNHVPSSTRDTGRRGVFADEAAEPHPLTSTRFYSIREAAPAAEPEDEAAEQAAQASSGAAAAEVHYDPSQTAVNRMALSLLDFVFSPLSRSPQPPPT